jgi:hypothetical protein
MARDAGTGYLVGPFITSPPRCAGLIGKRMVSGQAEGTRRSRVMPCWCGFGIMRRRR